MKKKFFYVDTDPQENLTKTLSSSSITNDSSTTEHSTDRFFNIVLLMETQYEKYECPFCPKHHRSISALKLLINITKHLKAVSEEFQYEVFYYYFLNQKRNDTFTFLLTHSYKDLSIAFNAIYTADYIRFNRFTGHNSEISISAI